MKIVFGINHFLIKSYKPSELGLPGEETDYTIELRQEYFHLFWIPSIGIQKMWCIRKEGELYDVPYDFKKILDSFDRPNMPWYTFSGLILAVLIAIGCWGYSEYNVYQFRQYHVEWVNKKNDMINNPKEGDQYTFIVSNGRRNIMMNAKELKQDSILFVIPEYQLNPINSEILCEYGFVDSLTNMACVWLDKAVLLDISCQDPEKLIWFEGKEVEQLSFMTTEKIVLDRIDRQ